MADISSYLSEVQLALISSPVIAMCDIVRLRANADDGYIRIRATLVNGDYLEAAEYCVLKDEQIVVVDYRFQWMDPARLLLRRRWDNTPHHPANSQLPSPYPCGERTKYHPWIAYNPA